MPGEGMSTEMPLQVELEASLAQSSILESSF